MGVVSDGSYNIPKGLIFSFPVTCQPNGRYQIVQVNYNFLLISKQSIYIYVITIGYRIG